MPKKKPFWKRPSPTATLIAKLIIKSDLSARKRWGLKPSKDDYYINKKGEVVKRKKKRR